MSNLEQFFWTARERQNIRRLRTQGADWPWTSDVVFQNNRFCNVFREDDRVTTWFRGHVRAPLRDNDDVFFATVAFRWFNLIKTGDILLDMLRDSRKWDYQVAAERLHAAGSPTVTGAYIIKSPDGMTKIDGLVNVIDNIHMDREHLVKKIRDLPTLRNLHTLLLRYPYMGEFMAYQVVCDMRFTHLLERAPDINDWTCPGPGSARGMGWLLHNDPERYNYHSHAHRAELVQEMRRVLEESRDPALWPTTEPAWELSTVQHWACEYDKWRRGHAGQRLKRRFERPAEQDWRD